MTREFTRTGNILHCVALLLIVHNIQFNGSGGKFISQGLGKIPVFILDMVCMFSALVWKLTDACVFAIHYGLSAAFQLKETQRALFYGS